MDKLAKSSADKQDNHGRAREIVRLVRRAEKGDGSALKEVRNLFASQPILRRIWDAAADMERSWINVVLGESHPVHREALALKLAEIRNDVAGPNPAPLDELLAERIALCWLQAQYADAIYAQQMPSLTLDQAEHFQKRQDRSHWRLLTAIKALAQVRKLGVPALQLNIADKQVNVIATDAPTSE